MPRTVKIPAPASAPATRAESMVARENESAPIRRGAGMVSPIRIFRSA